MKVARFFLVVSFLCLPFALAPQARAQRLTDYVTVDVPGAVVTMPMSINNRGDIVGFYANVQNNTDVRGFVLSNGQFQTISFPGAQFGTWALSSNNHGAIVGEYFDGSSSQGHGFFLRMGRSHPLISQVRWEPQLTASTIVVKLWAITTVRPEPTASSYATENSAR